MWYRQIHNYVYSHSADLYRNVLRLITMSKPYIYKKEHISQNKLHAKFITY